MTYFHCYEYNFRHITAFCFGIYTTGMKEYHKERMRAYRHLISKRVEYSYTESDVLIARLARAVGISQG